MKTIAEIFGSYEELDPVSGRHVNGTDKNGPNHHYGAAYAHIIGIMRATAKLIMEVGVADGSSLLAWSEVFPYARCVGFDIMPDPMYKLDGKERIEFHVGDMRSMEDCWRAASWRQFDFICEDATHKLEDSLVCLLYLWPFVAPGGIYVIEEFANVGALRNNIKLLWPGAEIVDTQGPFGGVEPLVVLRKSL